jgi:hypothetical protein
MTIEELRDEYHRAREAHSASEGAVRDAKVNYTIAGDRYKQALLKIDGSVEAERDYLDVKEALNDAHAVVHDAEANWARTEQVNRQAYAAYLAALDGEAEHRSCSLEVGGRKTPKVKTKSTK